MSCSRHRSACHPQLNSFHSLADSGAVSTILLFFLDMKKSRQECEEFVEAEARREAFAVMSARWAEDGSRRVSASAMYD